MPMRKIPFVGGMAGRDVTTLPKWWSSAGDRPIAVVTGGNRGIGFEISRQLSRAGVAVVIASRDELKGKEAVAAVRSETPDALVETFPADITNIESIYKLGGENEAPAGTNSYGYSNSSIMPPAFIPALTQILSKKCRGRSAYSSTTPVWHTKGIPGDTRSARLTEAFRRISGTNHAASALCVTTVTPLHPCIGLATQEATQTFLVNFDGTRETCKALLPLLDQSNSRIVNTGSRAGSTR